MSARTSTASLAAVTRGLFRVRRPRTGQKVHRNSYNEGEREAHPWKQHNVFEKSEHNARMRAAEAFDDLTRKPGRRNGALGHIALVVYRKLLQLRGRATGRLDPSYAWLAAELNRSRSAVFRAIKRLKQHGFLDWIRRTRPIKDPEPDGQHTEQIPNAYILELRDVAADMVRRIMRKPTEKLRKIIEEKRRAAEIERTTTDAIVARIADPELRRVLERIDVALDSANPPKPINRP